MPAETVHVEGVDQLARAFGRVDKGLRRELQKQLRVIGKVVADRAKAVAAEEGLHSDRVSDKHRGELIARIGVSVRGGNVWVRDSARTPSPGKWGNYNYPARFEFQHGGQRSFLRRALHEERGEVVHRFEALLDWVADEWGRS